MSDLWKFACCCLAAVALAPTAEARQPNVVVFFVDDLGWTDLGCYGSDFYETPNIDRLAATGVRFTNAYAACTVCSPSRAALMTGKYPARLNLTDFIPGHRIENAPLAVPDWTQRLELEQVTIAEVLREAGYRTAHFGKWHLTPRTRNDDPNDDGNFPRFYPDEQGFEFNFGGCERGAPASYFWPYGRGETLTQRKQNNTYRTLPEGSGSDGTYLTDQLADEAVKLIRSIADDPFFISFPFYNVHTPLQGKPDLVRKYEQKLADNPDVRHDNVQYAAMIQSVDEAVGKVVDALERHGIDDRTWVIFSSDNGGLYPAATTNRPLRQGKGSIYEGGVRVPTIVRTPDKANAGSVCDEPIITVDFFPTLLEATGTETSAGVDGLSLMPLIEDPEQGSLQRDAIFWHYPHYHTLGGVPYSAVRMGDWKLIERHDGVPVELYNLADDVHEDDNLADAEPARTRKMLNRLRRWRADVGGQMPSPNTDYDPAKPTGVERRGTIRRIGATREANQP